MTSRSTASSSTEATAEREAAAREAAERATRREFFRLFGRQTANSAGSVLAGVAALRQTGQEALNELLTPEVASSAPDPRQPGRSVRLTGPADAAEPALPAADALRSPYRFEGDELAILDQRELPERISHLRCRDASEVATAIRLGALGAGPVLAQVAAYSLLLAAQAAVDRSTHARRAALDAAADTLRAARPISRAIGWAVEGVLRAAERSDEPPAAVRAEADTIAMQAALDHARLGQLAAAALARTEPHNPTPAGRRLALLLVGDLGPLAGGMVGPGFALIQSLGALGRPAHVWLTDGAPLMEGRRAAWQLEQLDTPHTTVPDAGTGWLLSHRRIDAVLLRAEWITRNGDAIAPLGSVAVARQARDADVPVYAVAPTALLDIDDASALPSDLRMPSRSAGAARLDPAADMLSGTLLDGILTEEGVVAPPFAASLPVALDARAMRRAAETSALGAA